MVAPYFHTVHEGPTVNKCQEFMEVSEDLSQITDTQVNNQTVAESNSTTSRLVKEQVRHSFHHYRC